MRDTRPMQVMGARSATSSHRRRAPRTGSAILQEKQGGTFTAAYTHGNALLRRNSECPLYDGHGSERTVTNGSQTVTGTINFEAFGQTVGTSGSSDSPYMYAGSWGYRTDGDAGLMHVGARYYDPQVGRFITRDTVLSEHPYLYCEHDPVNAVDPSGHGSAWDWLKEQGRLIVDGVGAILGSRPPNPRPVGFRPDIGGLKGGLIANVLYDAATIGLPWLWDWAATCWPSGRPIRPSVVTWEPSTMPCPWGSGPPPPGTSVVRPYMGPGTARDPYTGLCY